ncbi:MAG: protease HtpX [Patescibacteria group bacterium]|nr:MAG: protease HtpX [Patescibacteria group bacterium]
MATSPYALIESNKRKTYLTFLFFIFVFTLFFYALGAIFESPGTFLVIGLFASIFGSFISYFYSDKIVLSMYKAKLADKEKYFDLYTVTENLCIAQGLPMPKVYVIEDESPNAFATGRDPKHSAIAVTTGLLKILDRSDLEGVIAHELSHIKNYDILVATIAAVLASIIGYASEIALRNLYWGSRSSDKEKNNNAFILILAIVAIILLPIAASLIQLAISRKREFLADSSAVLMTRNPNGLISALEKISSYPKQFNANPETAHLFFHINPKKNNDFVAKLQNLFSTHPPIEERIKNLKSLM